MAFGGVAMGSMNAQDAESVAGIISSKGFAPIARAVSPMIGTVIVHYAAYATARSAVFPASAPNAAFHTRMVSRQRGDVPFRAASVIRAGPSESSDHSPTTRAQGRLPSR